MIKPIVNLSPRMFLIFNFICFQSVWLIAVKLENQGLLLLIGILLCHFLVSQNKIRDGLTVLCITTLGLFVDSISSYLGIFAFNNGSFLPIWLVFLWANFALTFHYSMGWLMHLSALLQALLGAIFGTLSYYSAFMLGAVDFPLGSAMTIFYLLVIWSLTLPVYVYISRILQGKSYAKKSVLLSRLQQNC